MKTLLCLCAAALLVAVAVSVRAEDKPKSADAAATGGKPSSCVPSVKNPERHDQFMKDKQAALEKGPIQLVFVGDSITDAWRGGEQNKLFKERWGKYNPLNLGISGDKTEHVLWRLEHGELDGLEKRTKLVVMMIGTNNLGNRPQASPEDTAQGVECLVKTIREKLPEAKVLLLGVFPRGKEPSNPFRAMIKTVNDRISKLDDGQHVKYLDIGKSFLDDQGTLPADVMPDQLHPNAKGYRIWADAIDPTIEEMMKGS